MDGQHSSLFRGFHRGLSLFVGLMTALNLTGELLSKNFDANLWWIDLTPIPQPIASAFLGLLAILLLIHGLRPKWMIKPLRFLTLLALLVTTFATIGNGWVYIRLLNDHTLRGGYPLPFSWIVTLAMGLLFWGFAKPHAPAEGKSQALAGFLGGILALTLCFAGVPLAQMACYGNTDYARKADVAVVFGAKAYADGTCSQALAERVKKACELYKENLVSKLILSGGPGDGAVSEPQAMKALAVKLGVPENRIILDESGLNSAKTVEFTVNYLKNHPNEKIIAVSHFYHLPRIKMAFQRQGADPLTSPCVQNPVMSGLPRMMAREVLAIWWYYITPLAKE